eukprot:jgi/Mesen1/3670/ME000202S02755
MTASDEQHHPDEGGCLLTTCDSGGCTTSSDQHDDLDTGGGLTGSSVVHPRQNNEEGRGELQSSSTMGSKAWQQQRMEGNVGGKVPPSPLRARKRTASLTMEVLEAEKRRLRMKARSSSLRQSVAHAAAETWLITRLAFRLLRYLGYKAWGALLGQALSEHGVIVACVDYRNFPQGTVGDMLCDVTTAIAWIFDNIGHYGGDVDRVSLVGQSAGAHLASVALVLQAACEANATDGGAREPPWRPTQLKHFIGISGGMMEGEASLPAYSPELVVKSPVFGGGARCLPPITLYHGTGDYSIPHSSSQAFAAELEAAGARVRVQLYPGKTHTDLILQDPMRGGKDELLADILSLVYAQDEKAHALCQAAPPQRRMVPEILLQMAHYVSPF